MENFTVNIEEYFLNNYRISKNFYNFNAWKIEECNCICRGNSTRGALLDTYNLRWLRDQIGVLSQEPVLFGYPTAENIAFGEPLATREEVIAAARLANAHSFIQSFTNSYDTLVGEQGLSCQVVKS